MPCLLCWRPRHATASRDRSIVCRACLWRVAKVQRQTPTAMELLSLAFDRHFAAVASISSPRAAAPDRFSGRKARAA